MKATLIFNRFFWADLYYDIKWGVWALRKYFRVVWGMRDYDYNYNLRMMKFQLELLCDRIEFRGMEVDERRVNRVKDMRRVIELLHNQIEDNFTQRCGYDYNYKMSFVPSETGPDLFEMVTDETPDQIDNNIKAITQAPILEEQEWNELWDTIKNGKASDYGMRGWWD